MHTPKIVNTRLPPGLATNRSGDPRICFHNARAEVVDACLLRRIG